MALNSCQQQTTKDDHRAFTTSYCSVKVTQTRRLSFSTEKNGSVVHANFYPALSRVVCDTLQSSNYRTHSKLYSQLSLLYEKSMYFHSYTMTLVACFKN